MSKQSSQRELDAAALLWVARLPLVTAGDVEWLTGADGTDVQSALQALVRFGWVERVRVDSLEFNEDLHRYALRDVAVAPFAAVFQLDEEAMRREWPVGRRALLDHLGAFEVTAGLNRFLASLADDFLRVGTYEVVDLRALPRSRRRAGQWWPACVDGYGCLRRGDRYEHFFVAWDRRRAPDAHRSARVRAWYDAVDARDYRGSGRLPRILLVTPSRHEELAWKAAVSATARRRGDYDLDVAVITAADAFGDQPTGRVWRWLGEDYTEPITQMLDSPHFAPPFEQPRRARQDLLERGLATPAPPLQQWAARTLHAGRASGREQTAALRLTLDRTRLRMLDHAARHPYLSAAELASTLGEHPESAAHALRDLERRGLLGSLEQEAARSR
jgi:hypothetical protein